MNWKTLWSDARIAAAEGLTGRAADLFTLSMQEAQLIVSPEDPEFQVLLKDKHDFYKTYGNEIRTLNRISDGSEKDQGDFGSLAQEAATDSGEPTIWKLCSRCGVSTKDCQCENSEIQPKPDIERFEPGDTVARRYQIIKRLGSGGMAVVYLVRSLTDELFAMKILNCEFTADKEANERFEREALAIRKMRHKNIIAVFDFGKLSDGRAYFLMEFAQGQSLLSLLEKEVHLSVERSCNIFLPICDAMAHAHAAGVVHRDLKPSNILLVSQRNQNDQVKIVDFGIAKFSEENASNNQRLTQAGRIFGSPAYMSPEQCKGDEIDQRSDIYSVGCMLYQSLCGQPPFWAEQTLALLFKHINEKLPAKIPLPIGEIPRPLENIVFKALRKDPAERYQSMVEMESALLDFVVSRNKSSN